MEERNREVRMIYKSIINSIYYISSYGRRMKITYTYTIITSEFFQQYERKKWLYHANEKRTEQKRTEENRIE
jgi:hypothetical protein